jgi:hypothetical protein
MSTSNSPGDRVLTTKARRAKFTDEIAGINTKDYMSYKNAVKQLEGIARYFQNHTEKEVVEQTVLSETPKVQVVETQTGHPRLWKRKMSYTEVMRIFCRS